MATPIPTASEPAFLAALVAEVDRTKSKSTGVGCASVLVVGPVIAAAAWFGLEGSAWLRGLLALLAIPGSFVISLVASAEFDGRVVRRAANRFDALHPSGATGRAEAIDALARLPKSHGRDALVRELARRHPSEAFRPA